MTTDLIGLIVYTAHHTDGGRTEVRQTLKGYHLVAFGPDGEVQGSQPGPGSIYQCMRIADADDPA